MASPFAVIFSYTFIAPFTGRQSVKNVQTESMIVHAANSTSPKWSI